jgi:SOS-response transcriptional repressor LexA
MNEVLSYLEAFITANGYAPSVREISKHFGWDSPDTAQRRLRALVDEGKIVRVGPRAIRITDES